MAKTAAALHILVKHKEQAEDLLAQLKKGAKFQTLAKKHSNCPSVKKGGSLGSVDLCSLFLQRVVWGLYKAESMWCSWLHE